MTPDQMQMLSLKSTIEHTIRMYCTIHEMDVAKTSIETYAKNLQKAKMIKQYHFSCDDKKLDFTFKTPQDHGCTLTFLIRELRQDIYVPLAQIMSSVNCQNHMFTVSLGDIQPQDIVECEINFLSNNSMSQELCCLATWISAFDKPRQSILYVVPFIEDIEHITTIVEHICTTNSISFRTGRSNSGNSIMFNNESVINIVSLSMPFVNLSSQILFMDMCNRVWNSATFDSYISKQLRHTAEQLISCKRDKMSITATDDHSLFHKIVIKSSGTLHIGVDETYVTAFNISSKGAPK